MVGGITRDITGYIGISAMFKHQFYDIDSAVLGGHLDCRAAIFVPARPVRHVVQLVPGIDQHPGNYQIFGVRVLR